MRTSILFTAAVAAFSAAAAPSKRATPSGANVVVIGTTSDINNQNSAPVNIPVHIAYLAHSTAAISKLAVQSGSGTDGVNADDVECRMYKDAHGTQPGSAPFNTKTPAYVSTNAVSIGSILCYVVEQGE